MVRPAWQPPRHIETSTGEALQSDVMRFIAILALCLVAVFALVRSLPMHPVVERNAANPAAHASLPARTSTAQPSPDTRSASSPVPERVVAPEERTEPEPPATPAPPRRPVDQIPETSPAAAPPAPPDIDAPVKASASVAREGLTLRFASDTALLALVAQGRVRVYAWSGDTLLQLSLERGELRFAPGVAPKRFHSMMPDTVPSAVARALGRAAPTKGAGTLTWGVVLPADTEREVRELVTRHQDGTLIIEATGRVRFQQAGQ